MTRCLRPWHADLCKRQAKSLTIYLRDTGLLHCFLDVSTREELERHPIHAGGETFPLAREVRAVAANRMLEEI